jgi:hypothetical protein
MFIFFVVRQKHSKRDRKNRYRLWLARRHGASKKHARWSDVVAYTNPNPQRPR